MTRRTTNINAERVVVGSIIRSPQVYWSLSEAQVGAEHFSDKTIRQIFECSARLCEAGKTLTPQLLITSLPDHAPDGTSMAAQVAVLTKLAEDAGSALDYVDDLLEAFRWRKLEELASILSKHAEKTVEDLLAEVDAGVRRIASSVATQYERTLESTIKTVISKANDAHQAGVPPGITTGLPRLDEITGPLMPGDLVVIGAAQGESKTSLAVQIAMRAAERGPVAFFELEMSGDDLARRLLAGESSVKVDTIEAGAFEFDEFERIAEAGDRLGRYPLIIIDRPRMRVGEIRARALAIKHSRGLAAAVVDHLRLVQADGKVRDQFDRTEQVTGSLKALAKELGVPIILLSQRTRGSQDRESPEPRTTDLWGGGSIEQDADIIIGLWRRDLWLKQRKPKDDDEKKRSAWQLEVNACEGMIEAMCLKRRRGPSMEKRRFRFNGPATRLEEVP